MRKSVTLCSLLAVMMFGAACDHETPSEEELTPGSEAPLVGSELDEDARLDDDVRVESSGEEIRMIDTATEEETPTTTADEMGDPETPPQSDAIQEPPPLPPDDPQER